MFTQENTLGTFGRMRTGRGSPQTRIITGSVGANEGVEGNEMEIDGLKGLNDFFTKVASIEMHGERMATAVRPIRTHGTSAL